MVRLAVIPIFASIFLLAAADSGPSHGKIVTCYDIAVLEIKVDWNLCTDVIHIDKNFLAKLVPWEIGITGKTTQIKSVKDAYPHLNILYGIRHTLRKYFETAVSSESRSKFVEQLFNFTTSYNFNGVYLDIDLEPSDKRIKVEDRESFVLLLEELKEVFQRNKLRLSIGIGDDLGMGDVAAFAKHADYVYMSQNRWNSNHRHFVNSDLPASKIVETLYIVGTLQAKMYNFGLYTSEKNLVCSDICDLLAKKNWTKSYNNITYNNTAILDESNQAYVLTFPSSRSIAVRVRDAMRNKLAGIAILAIMDDFEGKCTLDPDTFVDFGSQAQQQFDIPDKSKFIFLRTANFAISTAIKEMEEETKLIKTENSEILSTTISP